MEGKLIVMGNTNNSWVFKKLDAREIYMFYSN